LSKQHTVKCFEDILGYSEMNCCDKCVYKRWEADWRSL